MDIELKYGRKNIIVNIPDENHLETICPVEMDRIEKPGKAVERALNNPIGSDRLTNLVNKDDCVIILASDITRPSPSHILIPPIIRRLNHIGVVDNQIKIIFGLGIHRKQTEEEKIKLVGKEIYERIDCLDHDITDCLNVGKTSLGTSVSLNKKVINADFIVATGNIGFHYFAGFSGGAKALAPGVAGQETIKQNHQHYLHKMARTGVISGNPVREDIEEMGEMVGIGFIVNAILNHKKEIVKVVAGDVKKAHRAGCSYIQEVFAVPISKLADIVIVSAGGFPKDIDLYQTHKAMENASLAVKKNGIIIVAGECYDGLGESRFAESMLSNQSLLELVDNVKKDFKLGPHKAARIAMINMEKKIFLVSELDDKTAANIFLKTFGSISSALQKALEIKGAQADISIMPYGNTTLPQYNGN